MEDKTYGLYAKFKEVAEEKGERYAIATFLASTIWAAALSDSVDEMSELWKEFRNRIPAQYVEDALAIADYADDDISVYEAADKYFEGVK